MRIASQSGDPATSRRNTRPRSTRHLQFLFATLTLQVAHCGVGAAQRAPQADWRSRCDAPLARIDPTHTSHGWTSVIVRLHNSLTPPQERLLAALHADIYRHLPIIESVALRVPTRNLAHLAVLPFVDHLSLDGQVGKTDQVTWSGAIRPSRAIWGAAPRIRPTQVIETCDIALSGDPPRIRKVHDVAS